MEKFEAKMKGDGLNAAAIAAFKHNYEQLVAGNDGIVAESDIEAISVRPPPSQDPLYCSRECWSADCPS